MFNLKDLMTMFNIPERTIRRHLKTKVLTGTKVGGTWRFTEEDLYNYLDKPIMKDIKAKNRLGKIINFLNGFHADEEAVIVITEKQKNDTRSNVAFSSFVNTLNHPFTFDMGKSGGRYIVTFAGTKADAVKLLDYVHDVPAKDQ